MTEESINEVKEQEEGIVVRSDVRICSIYPCSLCDADDGLI